MAKAPKSRPRASRPDVQPLGDHLAALLNPALVEKPSGFSEAPAAFEPEHPRGLTGAVA